MRFLAALALGIAAIPFGLAQTPAAPVSGLELRLEPNNLQQGLPQAFRFVLVNRSGHDIRLPEPSAKCHFPDTGFVSLRMGFVPLDPRSPMGLPGGCGSSASFAPGIMERVKTWQILRSGQWLEVHGDTSLLPHSYGESGKYDFWAEYDPPYVFNGDLLTLERSGIDIPHEKLSSNHVTFVKKP